MKSCNVRSERAKDYLLLWEDFLTWAAAKREEFVGAELRLRVLVTIAASN